MQWRSQLATIMISTALAGYLVISSHTNQAIKELPAPKQPGYYLNQATLVETGIDGDTRIKLHAARVLQNTESDDIKLEQVKVNFHSEDGTPWLLTAAQGQLATQSTTVQFEGDVLIRAEDEALQRPKIHTETLAIDTERSIASTAGPVNFVMDQQQVSGVGLEYDIKRQKLQLHAHVYGKFTKPNVNE